MNTGFDEQEDREYYIRDEEREFQLRMEQERTKRHKMYIEFINENMVIIAIIIISVLTILATILNAFIPHIH